MDASGLYPGHGLTCKGVSEGESPLLTSDRHEVREGSKQQVAARVSWLPRTYPQRHRVLIAHPALQAAATAGHHVGLCVSSQPWTLAPHTSSAPIMTQLPRSQQFANAAPTHRTLSADCHPVLPSPRRFSKHVACGRVSPAHAGGSRLPAAWTRCTKRKDGIVAYCNMH